LKGSSGIRGNSYVPFLGGWRAAMSSGYPMIRPVPMFIGEVRFFGSHPPSDVRFCQVIRQS